MFFIAVIVHKIHLRKLLKLLIDIWTDFLYSILNIIFREKTEPEDVR